MSEFPDVEVNGGISLSEVLTFHGLVPLNYSVESSSINQTCTNSISDSGVQSVEPTLSNQEDSDSPDTTEDSSNLGRTYLKCLFCSGLLILKNQNRETTTAKSIIKKTSFWFISFISLIYGLYFILFNLSYFLERKEKTDLVDLFYSVEVFVLSVYTIYLLGLKGDKFLQSFDLGNDYIRVIGVTGSFIIRYHYLAILVWLSSVLLAGTRVLAFSNWSLTDLLRKHAELWDNVAFNFQDTDSHNNGTTIDAYTTVPNTYSPPGVAYIYILGSITLVSRFCSYLISDIIQNILLVQAITINIAIKGFVRKIKNGASVPLGEVTSVPPPELPEQWKHYLGLRNMLEQTNETYEHLLKLSHMKNLFLSGYFLANILVENRSGFFFGTVAYALIKGGHLYYLASKGSSTNDIIKRWIKRQSYPDGRFVVEENSFNTVLLLEDLRDEPIGFGRGSFLIGEGFVFRFLGLVGSLAFLLVDESKGRTYLL